MKDSETSGTIGDKEHEDKGVQNQARENSKKTREIEKEKEKENDSGIKT